jgi:hypothetical protein
MSRGLTPQKLAVLERRKAVAERYLRQETQWEIAHALGISQPTVSRDLAAIQADCWHRRSPTSTPTRRRSWRS